MTNVALSYWYYGFATGSGGAVTWPSGDASTAGGYEMTKADAAAYPTTSLQIHWESTAGVGTVQWWLYRSLSGDSAGPLSDEITGTFPVDDAHRSGVIDVDPAMLAHINSGEFVGYVERAGATLGFNLTRFDLVVDSELLRRYRRPLRQFPRSDGLGSSSAPRVDANRSIQRSLRQGPGAYL